MPALRAPQRIAVTGANGFIGAHCVVALLQADFEVVAIVRDPSNDEKTGFLKEVAAKLGKRDKLSFAAGDLFQPGSYDDVFKGCQGVLHTAAVVEVEHVKDPQIIIKPSVDGTSNVVKAIQNNLDSIQRYVHLSSIAAIQSLEKTDDHVFTEADWNTWSTPESDPYGYGKTKAEQLVWEQLGDKESIETIVLNPVISLGPCYCKAHTKSSTVFIRQILYGNAMLNYNGSFVDVRDVAQAAVSAFTKDAAAGKRYIISGTEEPINTMELNTITKRVYPWVKGATPKLSPTMLSVLVGISHYLPFLQGTGPVPTEFQVAMLTRIIRCDNTQSKDVLEVTYNSLEDTCRDSVDSMKPFIKLSNWGGEEQLDIV